MYCISKSNILFILRKIYETDVQSVNLCFCSMVALCLYWMSVRNRLTHNFYCRYWTVYAGVFYVVAFFGWLRCWWYGALFMLFAANFLLLSLEGHTMFFFMCFMCLLCCWQRLVIVYSITNIFFIFSTTLKYAFMLLFIIACWP